MISEERLYRAFIAGLRIYGHSFVDTRNDDHHRRFALAIDVLNDAHAQDADGARAMPRGILPSPFTGRYGAFDRALLVAQETGASGARNPYYPGADLQMSEQRAQRILERFSTAERDLLIEMVKAFDRGTPGNLVGSDATGVPFDMTSGSTTVSAIHA